jgi:hypothetical protein
MVRIILSVLAGYMVMAVLVMISFGLVFLASAFIVYSLLTSVLAAVVGGYVTATVAAKRARAAVAALGGLVLALGLLLAVVGLMQPGPTPSAAEIEQMTPKERAMQEKEPLWYALSLPFLGAAGVIGGGALRLRQAISAKRGPG